MSWWKFGFGKNPPHVSRETTEDLIQDSLTASASVVRSADTSFLPTSESWQNEVWGYYDSLGEFRYAVDWKSRMMSRVRLYAAKIDPSQDEPIRLDDNSLAVQLVESLGGALGQSPLLADLSVQLDVPGEGYVIAETINGEEVWYVRSTDEIRKRNGKFEVVSEDVLDRSETWRVVADDHFIMRIYHPHSRRHSIADSASRAARSTMREIELVNRHIISQYLSRLASAGVVIFPEEVSFPVREEFADQPDPFVAEWIEIAAQAIREPGTASAVIPIPMKIPGEWLGKIQHIDFTLKIDENIIEKRQSAIRRLATQLNIPAEILTGMGDVNHWGAWQLEESALKTTIAPDAEYICAAFSTQYLQARLRASGEPNPEQFVVWYDMSELSIRPDRSSSAFQAYDRLEISGVALRRETGFEESDKPNREELREQALKVIINTLPSGASSALAELIGESVEVAPIAPVQAEEVPEPSGPDNTSVSPQDAPREEPGTQGVSPQETASVRTERLIRQSQSVHALRLMPNGNREILHPVVCEKHAYSCPYTNAALVLSESAIPGRAGIYECTLDSFGRIRVGDLSPHINMSQFVTGVVLNKEKNGIANGHRV